jgi:TIR domain
MRAPDCAAWAIIPLSMASIFVSYRREGGSGFAGRIEADLQRRFGQIEVFRDVDDLAAGEDFVQGLEHALDSCRVLIVVIGKTWLTATGPNGGRRLDDGHDFVRLEVSAALRRDVRVIPVLVEGASMPSEADLPDELKPLARRQAEELTDSRWDYDIGRLAGSIEEALGSGTVRDLVATRRRMMLAAAAGVLVAAAAAGWYYGSRPPDLAGTWDFPNGSYWIVDQTGRELAIREVHYESREVWKKGRGSIDGNQVDFKLDLVFERGYSTEGRLRIEDRGRRLTGVAVTRPVNTRNEVVLSKR